jgi:hypothetical protein
VEQQRRESGGGGVEIREKMRGRNGDSGGGVDRGVKETAVEGDVWREMTETERGSERGNAAEQQMRRRRCRCDPAAIGRGDLVGRGGNNGSRERIRPGQAWPRGWKRGGRGGA